MVASNAVRAGRMRGCGEQDRSTVPASIRSATRLLDLFPAPNVPGTGFFNNNFISNGILNNDVDQFDIRVDHRIGAGSDHAVRALQLPEHRSASSRRCSKIRWRRATSPATS